MAGSSAHPAAPLVDAWQKAACFPRKTTKFFRGSPAPFRTLVLPAERPHVLKLKLPGLRLASSGAAAGCSLAHQELSGKLSSRRSQRPIQSATSEGWRKRRSLRKKNIVHAFNGGDPLQPPFRNWPNAPRALAVAGAKANIPTHSRVLTGKAGEDSEPRSRNPPSGGGGLVSGRPRVPSTR